VSHTIFQVRLKTRAARRLCALPPQMQLSMGTRLHPRWRRDSHIPGVLAESDSLARASRLKPLSERQQRGCFPICTSRVAARELSPNRPSYFHRLLLRLVAAACRPPCISQLRSILRHLHPLSISLVCHQRFTSRSCFCNVYWHPTRQRSLSIRVRQANIRAVHFRMSGSNRRLQRAHPRTRRRFSRSCFETCFPHDDGRPLLPWNECRGFRPPLR
jgi:hypothetical protein